MTAMLVAFACFAAADVFFLSRCDPHRGTNTIDLTDLLRRRR